ncbi:MAG: hypothetical protein ACO3RQ_08895 [Litorivicinaceae bacterium]
MIDNKRGAGINIIPTRCPRFMAACVTAGVKLEEGSPGISNCYSAAKKYDPDEPGTVSYLLDRKSANPLAIAKIWANPTMELEESEALPVRMVKARTNEEWASIADDLDVLHMTAGIAHMRLFECGKFTVDSQAVSDNEERAAQILSDMAGNIRNNPKRNGAKIAATLKEHWNPAMFAWVKAWIANYLELRDTWKHANPSIKIEREGRFPLIIPKGKDFAKLMKRWAN